MHVGHLVYVGEGWLVLLVCWIVRQHLMVDVHVGLILVYGWIHGLVCSLWRHVGHL